MRVLIVDDDPRVTSAWVRCFRDLGIDVEAAPTAAEGLRRASSRAYDAVALDWNLPDGDGLQICDAAHARNPRTVVVIVTGRGDVEDRLFALESGADDYMVKPIDVNELVARIRAHQRHRERVHELRVGEIEVRTDRNQVRVCGQVVVFTQHEWLVLLCLAESAPRLVTREALLRKVWETSRDETRKLDVHMSNIRSKLGKAASQIVTERGVGFSLRYGSPPRDVVEG